MLTFLVFWRYTNSLVFLFLLKLLQLGTRQYKKNKCLLDQINQRAPRANLVVSQTEFRKNSMLHHCQILHIESYSYLLSLSKKKKKKKKHTPTLFFLAVLGRL